MAKKYPKLEFIPAPGTALRKNPIGFLLFLKELIFSFRMTLKFIRRNDVDAVVAFGGFTSLGPSLAARWQGIPIFTHEANRAVGKAVRFLARYCRRVYLPEGMLMEGVSNEKIRNIGYPLRESFAEFLVNGLVDNSAFLTPPNFLLFWRKPGSTVTQSLGEKKSACSLCGWYFGFCITGMSNESTRRIELIDDAGNQVMSKFVSFTDEMNSVLSAADTVVTRAGAGSWLKLYAVGFRRSWFLIHSQQMTISV